MASVKQVSRTKLCVLKSSYLCHFCRAPSPFLIYHFVPHLHLSPYHSGEHLPPLSAKCVKRKELRIVKKKKSNVNPLWLILATVELSCLESNMLAEFNTRLTTFASKTSCLLA